MNAALLTAVQPHPLAEVTVTMPGPPAAGTDWLAGEIENEQVGVAPLWLTVKVCPATVSVPVRELVDVLAAAE